MKQTGAIAAGSRHAIEAGVRIFEEGGNAFDAVLAAHLVSCLTESCLTSLGGGGFLLARKNDSAPVLYDFFVQTPGSKDVEKVDFYQVLVDFGSAVQPFQIGMGSVCVPGGVAMLSAVHEELCSLPLSVIIEPAIELAREGYSLTEGELLVPRMLADICLSTPESRSLYESREVPGELLRPGERFVNSDFASFLECLAREGAAVFYQGEVGKALVNFSRERGGFLRREDLAEYSVKKRTPLKHSYRDWTLFTNPPPSSGGILVALALQLLEGYGVAEFGLESLEYVALMKSVMEATSQARLDRIDNQLHESGLEKEVLESEFLSIYRQQVADRFKQFAGTTHVSAVDADGNLASMTTSNGATSGCVVPGTGIMLNNILGEDDLMPAGHHSWVPGERVSSMMSPSLLVAPDGRQIAFGTGGSKRIRSAVLQHVLHTVDFELDLREAIEHPRLHLDDEAFHVEAGLPVALVKEISGSLEKVNVFHDKSLFFGGVHAVEQAAGGALSGYGDPRRHGVAAVV